MVDVMTSNLIRIVVLGLNFGKRFPAVVYLVVLLTRSKTAWVVNQFSPAFNICWGLRVPIFRHRPGRHGYITDVRGVWCVFLRGFASSAEIEDKKYRKIKCNESNRDIIGYIGSISRPERVFLQPTIVAWGTTGFTRPGKCSQLWKPTQDRLVTNSTSIYIPTKSLFWKIIRPLKNT